MTNLRALLKLGFRITLVALWMYGWTLLGWCASQPNWVLNFLSLWIMALLFFTGYKALRRPVYCVVRMMRDSEDWNEASAAYDQRYGKQKGVPQ